MIVQGLLMVAAAVVAVAVLTGKNIRERSDITAGGMRYQLTRFSDDTILIVREDGLEFVVDAKTGQRTLKRGTVAQLQDAAEQLRGFVLNQLQTQQPPQVNA